MWIDVGVLGVDSTTASFDVLYSDTRGGERTNLSSDCPKQIDHYQSNETGSLSLYTSLVTVGGTA